VIELKCVKYERKIITECFVPVNLVQYFTFIIPERNHPMLIYSTQTHTVCTGKELDAQSSKIINLKKTQVDMHRNIHT
jgi:hypothetical protein